MHDPQGRLYLSQKQNRKNKSTSRLTTYSNNKHNSSKIKQARDVGRLPEEQTLKVGKNFIMRIFILGAVESEKEDNKVGSRHFKNF